MTKRGFQVGFAQVVLHELKTFKLRYRYLEGLTDPFQVAVSCLAVERGSPRDEVAAKRLSLPPL